MGDRGRDGEASGDTPAYRDPGRPVAERVADLLKRMTLAEKAGLMFQQMAAIGESELFAGADGDDVPPSAFELIDEKHLTHFNLVDSADPAAMAGWHNRLQERARETRLGIPVTLSTDPRSAFTDHPGISFLAGPFSQWPEPLGLAAVGDEEMVREFADIVRREYLSVGIRVSLHPQADLATEPRWARISGTFGEDADLAARMVRAYVEGFQTTRLGPASVATMIKHFPGGGPQKDGEDPHFPYGREQVYPGDNLAYHLAPFEAAFEAGASQVMPYYGMPVGTDHDEVGFGFNRSVITGLLREKYGFDGIICTDWCLINDFTIWGEKLTARAWGLEHRTPLERVEQALNAGVDQFGGEHCPELVVELVESGRIPPSRIDESARRLLREKLVLGLFDAPFVDPVQAESVVGAPEFVEAGHRAQCRSITVLTNGDDAPILPVHGRPRLYAPGLGDAVSEYAEMVDDPERADLALLRVKAPFEKRSGAFEQFLHAGSLEFPDDDLQDILDVCRRVPTIIDLSLDRPAVVPEILRDAAAVIADYGASDRAILDVVFGRHRPQGRLPFDLPSSMATVAESRPDVPFDTAEPLLPQGHGLRTG